MIVILNKDVKGTGKSGEVVDVKDGYARNMLIPRGLAVEATDGNMRTMEKVMKKRAADEAAEKAAAEKQAEKIAETRVVMKTNAGDNGRLFGSITNKDIADALSSQRDINIDKRKIVMDQPIKELGVFKVEVKLYPEVSANLTVEVSD